MNFEINFILLNLLTFSCQAAYWGYIPGDPGPDEWPKIPNTMCGGQAQSPIDISSKSTRNIVELQVEVRINQTRKYTQFETFGILNDGKSLQISIPVGKWGITLNKNSKDHYTVSEINFHWGSTLKGSEHSIDGEFFPLEMQIYAYDSVLYPNAQTAARSPKGLAAIAVLYELNEEADDLSYLGDLSSLFKSIIDPETLTSVLAFPPESLLPGSEHKFYRYQGSMTIPPCTENVQWTVLMDKLSVSSAQLAEFRKLKFRKNMPMVDNFRPTQILNPEGIAQQRFVYKSS